MTAPAKANPIPNILTGVRLFAGIVMFLMLAGATGGVPILSAYLSPADQFELQRNAFIIFVVAASTDWVDGYLARRWNSQTRWGAILDPIADKVLVAGAMLGVLTSGATASVIIPFGLILFREFAVSALRETTAGRVELPVTLMAKWKTTLQMIGLAMQLLAIVLREPYYEAPWFPNFVTVADLVIWVAAIATVWTGWDYFREARRQMG